MTRIALAPEVFDDFDRFFEHIAQFDVGAAPERIGEILDAVQILASSPMIGRPVKGGKRELVIGRDSRGNVALYRYVAPLDDGHEPAPECRQWNVELPFSFSFDRLLIDQVQRLGQNVIYF
jgi:plasmid stabilization system protein ParE